jgi:hypothetical protein
MVPLSLNTRIWPPRRKFSKDRHAGTDRTQGRPQRFGAPGQNGSERRIARMPGLIRLATGIKAGPAKAVNRCVFCRKLTEQERQAGRFRSTSFRSSLARISFPRLYCEVLDERRAQLPVPPLLLRRQKTSVTPCHGSPPGVPDANCLKWPDDDESPLAQCRAIGAFEAALLLPALSPFPAAEMVSSMLFTH